MTEREQLEQAIAALEGQRATLGDAVVDAMITTAREKLATLAQAGREAPMTGERKLVTVMFADISGFTALSEKMDPEAVRDLMNNCFERLVPCITHYEGTIDKFIGDEIMALFGAPLAHENDAERAVRAALDMMAALADFNIERGVNLGLHFGINTGLVLAGGIGSNQRQEYSVMGDAVNLAARLEDASERGQIFIGPDTYRLISPLFEFEILKPITVKGKAEPVAVYRVISLKTKPGSMRGLERQGLASPLVGRAREVAAIEKCIDRLLKGEGGIISIIGEAGLGKSRLIAEIRGKVEATNQSPPQWLEGYALSFGQTISYWPFQQILRNWAGITEDDNEERAWGKLERQVRLLFAKETIDFLPYLASLLALEVQGEYRERVKHLDGEAMGKQIFLTSRRFFERLAQTKPLVLLFEDLHWIDESSVNLLEHLLPVVESAPLLIIGLTRPEQGSSAVRWQETATRNYADHYLEIQLEPLSKHESAQMVLNLLEIDNLPLRVRQMIFDKAEGNPFFLEEVIRTLLDTGVVTRDPATGRWQATTQIESLAIPNTIQGVIMARVDRLDEQVKHVLQVAAVIGRTFLYRILKVIAEAEQHLDEHLAELQHHELIRQKQAIPEVEYIFKHALAQEVTYQSILLQKRRDLHAQVGQAIETLLTDRPEEFYGLLAYHYAKAEAWEKAQVYLLKAGDQAGRVAADTEALNHYQQALAAYSRAFGNKWRPVQRAALAHKMGEALLRRGEHTQAFEDLRRALGYLGHPLPASRWGMRLTILREIALQGGHRLLPGLFLTSPGRPVTEAVEEEGRIYESMVWIVAVNPEHFLLIVLKLLNFSERNGFLPGAIIGFAALQLIADFMGLFWLARYYAQKAVVLAESGQHPGAQSAAYTMRAIHENIQGQWYTSIEYAQRAADIQQQSGYWNVRSWALSQMNLADAYVHLGNFSRALEYSQELTRFGQDSGDRQAWCWGLARQGFARRGLGQLETAEANLTEAMELAKSVPDYQTYVDAGGELGQCYLCQGKLDKALTVFEECRRRSLDHNLMKSPVITRFRNGLVEAYLMAAGRSAGAERAGWLKKARRACSDALRQAKAYPPGKAEAMMLRGNYEWLKGKQTAAKDWWQRSLTLAETMEVRYNLARTHLAMGQYLGERAHLEKAEAIFSEIGAAWDLAQTK